MKFLINESKVNFLISNYVDTLYSDLTINDEHRFIYWTDTDGETIFTYDKWDNELYIPSELINDIVNLFGLKYTELKPILLDVFNQKLDLKLDKVRPI